METLIILYQHRKLTYENFLANEQNLCIYYQCILPVVIIIKMKVFLRYYVLPRPTYNYVTKLVYYAYKNDYYHALKIMWGIHMNPCKTK
ncbi:uncharacterized protein L203_105845 [Cryptococcus depauperatus CBS 7841]|uniref:Uncharacterized protein n=1 Tax=Cryptococcus depauperatus CBS 7841 TaxID=1295531 RepID=A0AAJ8JYD4_9TREE